MNTILNPPGWKRPKGYSNGVMAKGQQIHVAGMIGWNGDEVFETDDFVGQAKQALQNVVAVIAEAGAGPEHIVSMTWYITDRDECLARQAELGQAYREVIGRNFPAMAMVQVVALMEERAKIEIEARAVLPE